MGDYSRLAGLMSTCRDVVIFRTFEKLNVRNVLYLQAELAHLEAELDEITERDRKSGRKPVNDYAKSWHLLRDSEGGTSVQVRLVLSIRALLEKYNTALIQQAQLANLAKANAEDLNSIRSWLERPGYGDNFLAGRIEDVWDLEKGNDDFVALGRRAGENDLFTRLIAKTIPHIQRRIFGDRRDQGIYSLEASSLTSITNGLATMAACVMPTLAIICLYLVKRMEIRLGMTVIFTALLATTLIVCTRARRVEIFGATTAFAAVMVVFVGSTGCG